MCLNEASWLVHLVSGDSKYSPFKYFLRDFSFCKILVLVFCSFLVQGKTRVWIYPEIHPLKNFDLELNRCALGRHNFLCKWIFKIPNFVEPSFLARGRGERVSPCESCSIQARSDTMLMFHMLS